MEAKKLINLTDPRLTSLFMLIGPEGSGKHDFANELIRYAKPNTEIVSTNDIRKNICENIYDQTKNKEVFSQVYKNIANKLDDKYDIIYVSTNCRLQYRKKIIDICKYKYDRLIGIVFTRNLINCIEHNPGVDISQIEDNYVELRKRPPHPFEGFDAIITCNE